MVLRNQRQKNFQAGELLLNAVAPGYVDTDMTKVLSDNIRNEILKNIPLQRMGNVEDISNALHFLHLKMLHI